MHAWQEARLLGLETRLHHAVKCTRTKSLQHKPLQAALLFLCQWATRESTRLDRLIAGMNYNEVKRATINLRARAARSQGKTVSTFYPAYLTGT